MFLPPRAAARTLTEPVRELIEFRLLGFGYPDTNDRHWPMTVRADPEKRTRTPCELGFSPAAVSRMPACASSSLNRPMAVSSSGLGITPASESVVALTSTITRMSISLRRGDRLAQGE